MYIVNIIKNPLLINSGEGESKGKGASEIYYQTTSMQRVNCPHDIMQHYIITTKRHSKLYGRLRIYTAYKGDKIAQPRSIPCFVYLIRRRCTNNNRPTVSNIYIHRDKDWQSNTSQTFEFSSRNREKMLEFSFNFLNKRQFAHIVYKN